MNNKCTEQKCKSDIRCQNKFQQSEQRNECGTTCTYTTHTHQKKLLQNKTFFCVCIFALSYFLEFIYFCAVCVCVLSGYYCSQCQLSKKKLRKVHKETRIPCFIFFLSKSTTRAKFLMRMLCRHWMRILNDRNKFETIFRFMEMSVRAFKYVKSFSWQTNRYPIDMTPNGHRQRQEARGNKTDDDTKLNAIRLVRCINTYSYGLVDRNCLY